jgi:hypothetical protein
MIRCGWACHIRVVILAEGKFPRVGKICRDVLLDELLADGGRLASEPRGMVVRRVARGWIR